MCLAEGTLHAFPLQQDHFHMIFDAAKEAGWHNGVVPVRAAPPPPADDKGETGLGMCVVSVVGAGQGGSKKSKGGKDKGKKAQKDQDPAPQVEKDQCGNHDTPNTDASPQTNGSPPAEQPSSSSSASAAASSKWDRGPTLSHEEAVARAARVDASRKPTRLDHMGFGVITVPVPHAASCSRVCFCRGRT